MTEILRPLTPEQRRALEHSGRIARLMDYQLGRGPFRFGLDAVLGLIPGVGDVTTGAIGLYFLKLAHEAGVPKHKMAGMVANLAIDTAIGAIPLIGDVFDFGFRAHQRNAEIIRRHIGAEETVDISDTKRAAPAEPPSNAV